jgi:hypothetical protein
MRGAANATRPIPVNTISEAIRRVLPGRAQRLQPAFSVADLFSGFAGKIEPARPQADQQISATCNDGAKGSGSQAGCQTTAAAGLF